MIAVEGTIQTSNFTDKNGAKRKQIEVLANNVSFCGGKSENGSQGTQSGMDINPEPTPSYSSVDNSDFEEIVDDDDDLPF